jgi:tRNA dimethylallyltransferase
MAVATLSAPAGAPSAPGEAASGRVVAVVGATATGKSRLALAMAEALEGEIINADALQVYRGFDIGTAKPSPAERARVPHHLIDILEPHERWSAGEFSRRARAAIAGIRERGRVPIVVGGSGLYLRALLAGISPVPPGDPALRQELRARLAAEGLPALAADLARLDPATASRLAPGDTQRILRALEVALASGRPLSSWIASQPFGKESVLAISVGLTLPRGILYDEVARRVTRMVERGWVQEVRGLLDRGLEPHLPAFQAIGYRQIALHVLGEWSLDRAVRETVQATRRFAKRQETWFRREPDVTWFPAQDLDRRTPQILDHVMRSGLGRANA